MQPSILYPSVEPRSVLKVTDFKDHAFVHRLHDETENLLLVDTPIPHVPLEVKLHHVGGGPELGGGGDTELHAELSSGV